MIEEFVEFEAYRQRGIKLKAALTEREQFLERLTALRSALKKLERYDFDLAVAAVKDTPEKDLVQALCERVAGTLRLSGRRQDILDVYVEEAGDDPETFDPWEDHGV